MGKLIPCPSIPLGFALLMLSGCSTLYQHAVATLRQPGEQVATTPERIWREFDCDNRERPFVRAESMEVLPERIHPGGRVNYRLIYIMCPVNRSEVIMTSVSRRILYNGQQVAASVNDRFEIKPGRWIVDSFFTLPKNAPPGVYALEGRFEAGNSRALTKVDSFLVGRGAGLGGG